MKLRDIIEDISISNILNTNPRSEYLVMYRVLDSIFTMHDVHKIINNSYYYKEYKDKDVLYVDENIHKNISVLTELIYPRTLIKEFYRHKFGINTKFKVLFGGIGYINSLNKKHLDKQKL